MNDFFKELQKLYLINNTVEAKIDFKNNRYKIRVFANGEEILMVSAMSAYSSFDLAYTKLCMQREKVIR